MYRFIVSAIKKKKIFNDFNHEEPGEDLLSLYLGLADLSATVMN